MKNPTEGHTSGRSRYLGMTKRQYKQMKANSCSEPGQSKSKLCQASALDKAMLKYPRAIKVFPVEYFRVNLRKDLADPNHKESFFTKNRY